MDAQARKMACASKNKRQKDLADILRLVEAHPELAARLPEDVAKPGKEC